MATIERRYNQAGTVTYRVKVRLRGYPVQSATFQRLTGAKKWVQQTESAIREGRLFKSIESKRRTLAEAIQRYSETVLLTKTGGRAAQHRRLAW